MLSTPLDLHKVLGCANRGGESEHPCVPPAFPRARGLPAGRRPHQRGRARGTGQSGVRYDRRRFPGIGRPSPSVGGGAARSFLGTWTPPLTLAVLTAGRPQGKG